MHKTKKCEKCDNVMGYGVKGYFYYWKCENCDIKIIDNDNKGYWDDTSIMCNEISDIIYETVPFNDIIESNKGEK